MVDKRASVLAWFRQGAEGTQKIAEDIARYRIIVARVQPAVVVETGTGSGHFALFLAELGCGVDADLEGMFAATQNPGGWLRRWA